MIDRDLAERYRLERQIGQGGMATVYEGTDAVLRRRVAIKVLRPHLAADEAFVARFFSEAQHAAKLAHPNIVNVYDVGRAGESYYIVMELVEGTTLAEMIRTDGRLPERIAIDFAAQLCNGLAYAHRQGLLHRDVKPANVLITRDDVLKLSDFGIARATTGQTLAMTQPGLVFGSVSYLSPEQAQGRELGPTSDLYSLGVMLYEMLSGELPFVGDSPITVALHHVSSPVPTLDPDELAISPTLAAIVKRLLAKDPAERYPSAAAVASALREARERPLEPRPLPERAPGAPPRRVVAAPPPRPSPMPDRPLAATAGGASDAEPAAAAARAPRSIVPLLAVAIVVLLAAAVAGYLTTRPGGWRGAPRSAALASFVGQTAVGAERELGRLGLRWRVVPETSGTVPADRVLAQDPAPGDTVDPGSVVRLVVSSGPAPVTLIDLRSYSRDDAVRYLKAARLVPQVVGRYDKAVAGQVLDQRPSPGAAVPLHETVRLVVSKGPAPVAVPDLASLTLEDAKATLASRSLSLVVGERDQNDQIPAGVVISQSPAAGAAVTPGRAIDVVVSAGPPRLAIPDLDGRTLADAQAALQAIGLTASVEDVVDATATGGSVLKVDPAAGSQVARGTTVTLSVAVTGMVPDVAGRSLDDARTALTNDGYRVGNVAYVREGTTGAVVRTEPAATTLLRPGETVDIFVGGDQQQPAP